MPKFKFKLETVLRVKTRVEDLRKRELQEAEYRRNQARKQLERRQAEVAETVELYRANFKQNLDVNSITNYHKFLLWLDKQVELATMHLDQCEKEVTEKRQRLVEASKERKILEKLQEKAFEVFKAEELNAEIKFLDELGTGRFVRQDANERGGS